MGLGIEDFSIIDKEHSYKNKFVIAALSLLGTESSNHFNGMSLEEKINAVECILIAFENKKTID